MHGLHSLWSFFNHGNTKEDSEADVVYDSDAYWDAYCEAKRNAASDTDDDNQDSDTDEWDDELGDEWDDRFYGHNFH